MAAYALVTHGARTSATMVSTMQDHLLPSMSMDFNSVPFQEMIKIATMFSKMGILILFRWKLDI